MTVAEALTNLVFARISNIQVLIYYIFNFLIYYIFNYYII